MKNWYLAVVAMALCLGACKRDNYYTEGGLAKADYPGSMMKYLQDKKVPFDTIAKIVKLAGLENTFTTADFTFFAPDDDVIKRSIGNINTAGLNSMLYRSGRDTVKTLDQINPAVWKKFIQRYMFRGNNRLKDYSQIDFAVRSIYPGDMFYNYNNEVANIGVVFNDANGVRYIGYRQLVISYIPDISKPNDNWFTNYVSSSDIKPTNGVVHTLNFNNAYLGLNYSVNEFFNDVYNTGLTPSQP